MKHPGAKLASGRKPKKSVGKVGMKNGVKKISKKKVASNAESVPVASPPKRVEQQPDIELKDEDDIKAEEAYEPSTRVAKPVKDGSNRVARGGITKRKEKKPSTKEQLAQMSTGKERKAFLRSLKEKKPNFHVAQQTKILWEKIRSSKTEAEEKETCIAKLRYLVKGKASTLIYAHDTCRVIECLVALKRDDIRNELFEELTPEIVPMTKSKYAKFFVAKMFKYGSKEQRDQLIEAFRGHCVRMLGISTAARILETAYNDYANAQQRAKIVAEFYGPEFAMMAQELGREEPPSLNFVAKSQPSMITSVVKSLEGVLEKAIRRETLKLSLTHRLLLDYLTHCTAEQRKSVIETIQDHVPEIVHSREGSRAAMLCIWHADTKEQKAIVKSFKGLVLKTCCDEFARRALFAMFDRVEETALITEYIIKEIVENLGEIVKDKYGVWVLHYLVHPRDYRVFGKGLVELLKQGDVHENEGDRTRCDRYAELFGHVRESLLKYLAKNMREVIFDKTSSVLVLDTLEPDGPSCPFPRALTKKEMRPCFKAIAGIVEDEFSPDRETPHIVKTGCARFVFRKLLQLESKQEGVKLSDYLAELPVEQLSSFTSINSGCFALLEMLKSGSAKATDALRELNVNELKRSELVGAKALYQELSAAGRG